LELSITPSLYLLVIRRGELSFVWDLVLKMILTHMKKCTILSGKGQSTGVIFADSASKSSDWRMKPLRKMTITQACSQPSPISKWLKKI
jgi:hypothetical protein